MPSQAELIAFANRSPELVAAKDLAAWLSLFSADAIVCDPVGSKPVPVTQLPKFWKAFIAPREVSMEIHADFVSGLEVVRDVTINIKLKTGVKLTVPAHLRYEMVETDTGLRIQKLAAFWELAPVLRQLSKPSWAHLRSLVAAQIDLVSSLGVAGAIGFSQAFKTVGATGKKQVRELLNSPNHAANLPISEAKIIAAGSYISISCLIGNTAAVQFFQFRNGKIISSDIYQ